MKLQRIEIKQLRNIDTAYIEPSQRVNIICGANAAGKTSLLEAIYFLSCGRSFRMPRTAALIREKKENFSIVASLCEKGLSPIKLGVSYSKQQLKMRAGGVTLTRTSKLANYLPIIAVHQESTRIFTHGPKYRRQLLDWGLFHVEHSFQILWRRYVRVLKQRNVALRKHASVKEISIWDGELIDSATRIDNLRRRYVSALIEHYKAYCSRLLGEGMGFSIDYYPGWSVHEGYECALTKSLEKDRHYGYTRAGVHRADLSFKIDGHGLQDVASRGQQKLLVYAVYLSQAALFYASTSRSSIILVDDLEAELDKIHAERLYKLLVDLKNQVFITTTKQGGLSIFRQLTNTEDIKVFHVEHGKISEMV
ncbi:MAG: DNA replication/repair protein RecF [Gammaproteobacteria bacterium]